MRYRLSPDSFLLDSTLRPIFLRRAPLRKPRMLWFCQWVALAISVNEAPLGRRRSSRMVALFDPLRSSVAGWDAFWLAGFACFLAKSLLAAGLACFFGAAFLARWLALGAPLFWLAGLLRGGLAQRDGGALFGSGGALGVGGSFWVRHSGRILFGG